MVRPVAAALAASLLAGCAGGARVHSVTLFSPYTPLGAASFAASGPLVEVRGAPPGGASPEAVAAALRMPGNFAQTGFRVAPVGGTGQRIVLAFGARSVDPGRICAPGASGGASQSGGGLELGAAYCVGATAASVGVLSAPDVGGPEDPAFAASVRGLLTEMMPTSSPGKGQLRND